MSQVTARDSAQSGLWASSSAASQARGLHGVPRSRPGSQSGPLPLSRVTCQYRAHLPTSCRFCGGSDEVTEVRPQRPKRALFPQQHQWGWLCWCYGPPPMEASRTPGLESVGLWPVLSRAGGLGTQADRDNDGWGGLFRHIPCSFLPAPPPGPGERLPLSYGLVTFSGNWTRFGKHEGPQGLGSTARVWEFSRARSRAGWAVTE